MATKRHTGDAVPVENVQTSTLTGTWAAADTATITINGKDLKLTVGTPVTVTDVAAALVSMITGSAGTLKAIYAGCLVANVGDSTITIDIKQGNAAEGSTTVLSSVITLDSGDSNREAIAGSLSVTALNNEDVIEVVVNATIGTGTLGVDLFVILVYDENYPS